MLETISAAIASLSVAKDITQGAVSLRDEAKLSEAVRELNSIILSAQSSAIDAKVQISDLIDSKSQLEKELMALKEFSSDKNRYELHRFEAETLAYIIKESARGTEPVHHLCQPCFDSGKKSILQPDGLEANCNVCKARIYIRKPKPRPRSTYKGR